MSLKFTNNSDYILIESSTGMDFWEIMKGIPKLISMPEFKNKNDIWEFRSNQIKMSFADLQKIKNLVEKICPQNCKGTKTAIVVRNGFQQTYATLFSDICNDIQRKIRVFSDLKPAENWIIL
jgi:hypothetical protein